MKAVVAWVVVACVIGALAPSLARAAGSYPQTREGWLVGFGAGGGSAGVSGDSQREGGFAGSFRVGYAFQPEISLELLSSVWTKSENNTDVTFSVGGVGIGYYPNAQGLEGLVLRGGVGFGDVSVGASSGGTRFSASESGFGFTVGAAYEFRVTRTFAIGPQVDFGYLSINGESANFVNGSLGFNWYFIPRK